MIDLPVSAVEATVVCGTCGASIPLAAGTELIDAGDVGACIRCGGDTFYARKDFPRVIGCNIVLIAAILSFWTYMLSLVAASLIELAIYWAVPWVTTCYRCCAEYRGLGPEARREPFDHHLRDELEGAFEPPELASASPTEVGP